MRVPSVILFLAASLLCALASTSCSDRTKFRALCASDTDCQDRHGNSNWACDKQVGDCVCTGDGACMEKEHCEVRPGGDGRCHPNRGCDWNEDCDGNTWCDTANHICRLSGCEVDTNCKLGQICDQTSKTCVPGCRTHGDCATFGDVCLCMDDAQNPVPCVCDATTEAGRAGCKPGVCTSKTCADDSFCKWGEVCKPVAGEMLKQCVKDDRGPFCEPCELAPGGAPRCKNPNGSTSNGNYCLEDTMTASGQFCGVDCVDGQSCPNGFSCRDVRVVTGQSCTSVDACKPHPAAPSCTPATVDVDCPGGSRCVNGKCAATCPVSESGVRGYCGCVVDDECVKDTCRPDGTCEISGRRCIDGCNDVRCINDGSRGYCWIGRNCAPDLGIPCADVREGKGPYDH
ncbi:hypothetical protein [Vulgatibacter incomptus]|uniref:Tryptophan synthase alpha chain n=1 Tax=Vulgatibacter incomptus TaxID=1391653 RepID=A0A0K1PHT0_9BACT|nr:hypothetical protein [Vulgatibacter incomptus]AKU93067.1 hypothetical protein AKJ08_3454 [Vulgatibacter incomptus]